MTVREEIAYNLRSLYNMDVDDVRVCMEFAIQALNQHNPMARFGGMERKDGQRVKIAECWETDHNNYPDEDTRFLKQFVEEKALQWCVKQLKVLKAQQQSV